MASTTTTNAGTAALIAGLQALISAAQADAALTRATGAALAAAQEVVWHAQAVLAIVLAQASGVPARTVVVGQNAYGTETIFEVAERELGSLDQFPVLQKLNDLSFISLTAGQVLLVPSS